MKGTITVSVLLLVLVFGWIIQDEAFAQSTDTLFLPVIVSGDLLISSETPTPTSTQTSVPTSSPTRTSTSVPTHTSTPTSVPTKEDAPTETPIPLPTETPAMAIIHDGVTWFRDGIGGIHIVGQVENQDTRNIWLGLVRANFYDSASRLVATDEHVVVNKILPPGERGCFHIALVEPLDWDNFQLSSAAEYGGVVSPGTTILGVADNYNNNGELEVYGQIKNNSSSAIGSVHVAVTLFASDGRVTDCGHGFADNSFLVPGQTTNFLIRFIYHDPALIFSRFTWVQGEPQ